jgi:hypothetical protein
MRAAITATRRLRLNLAFAEEALIRQRALCLEQLDWIKRKWGATFLHWQSCFGF